MRKLIPVLLLTFCASAAYSQSSPVSDRASNNETDSFAESLRLEIVTDIKKKLASDTALQRTQQSMSELLKACGIHPTVKVSAKTDLVSVYKTAPVTLANIINDFARNFMTTEGIQNEE